MKRFAVIGLGRFGYHVARALFQEGHEVVAMDSEKAPVQQIEPFCSEAIVLDATEKDRLKALGLDMMDAVIVSIGTHISNSILICMYLQEMGVKRIIAKALDEDHAKILSKVGATDIVHPEKDMGIRIARELSSPNILDFIPLGKDFTISQLQAPDSFAGKTLGDLNLRARHNIYVVAVGEAGQEKYVQMPAADFRIKTGDVLVVLGSNKDIQSVRSLK